MRFLTAGNNNALFVKILTSVNHVEQYLLSGNANMII
jgi:hypothetical protein